MKKTRRFIAMTAAMALTACTLAPIFTYADTTTTTTGGIIINNPTTYTSGTATIDPNDDGVHTYEAYQIFSGVYSKNDTKEILSSIEWGSGISLETNSDIYENLFGIGLKKSNPAHNTDATAPEFIALSTAQEVADALSTYSFDNATVIAFANIVAGYLSNTKTTSSISNGSPIITGLADGYYLIQDVAGGNGSPVAPSEVSGTTVKYDNSGAKTRYILKVKGDEAVTLTAKSSAPSVMKKVQEESLMNDATAETAEFAGISAYALGDGYNDIADYDIGDNVPFKLYGSLPSTYSDYKQYYYEFEDTLGSQFGEPTDIKVYVDGKEVKYDTTTNAKNSYSSAFSSGKLTVTFNDLKALPYLDAASEDEDPTPTISPTYTLTEAEKEGLEEDATGGYTFKGEKVTVNEEIYTIPNKANPAAVWVETAEDEYEPANITNTSIITVEYTAELTASANIGRPGQVNAVKLNYSNNPNQAAGDEIDKGETPNDGVIVFTYSIAINKTDTAKRELANAYFAVYKLASDNVTKQYIKTDEDGKFDGFLTTAPAKAGNEWAEGDVGNDKGVWKSASSGNIVIEGLDAGTYYIEELQAPTNYNKLTNDVEVTITATMRSEVEDRATETAGWNRQNWTYSASGDSATAPTALMKLDITNADENGVVNIANSTGASLPETGGIGTTLFYVGGGCMVGIAGILLIAKKRAKESQN